MPSARRGSAILIAVFLITAIGAIAFSFGRVLFTEVASSSIYENGIGAYFSAESGLEEGFLRYRYDQAANVPLSGNSNNVYRYNLTNQSAQADVDKAVLLADQFNSKQFVDLSVNPTADSYGRDANGDGTISYLDLENSAYAAKDSYPEFYISRDESKKFDFSDVFDLNDANLLFLPVSGTAVSTPNYLSNANCAMVEVKITGEFGGQLKEKKELFTNAACTYPASLLYDKQYQTDESHFLISNLKTKIWNVPLEKATLTLRPIGADIKVMFKKTGGTLYGPFTAVSATGYYGGLSKTLKAEIDRQSGTLYDLFDYVIYSKQ